MKSKQSNVSKVVHRRLLFDLHCTEAQLQGAFRWLDEYALEDVDWFLGAIEDDLGSELFPRKVDKATLDRIATVDALVSYVEEQLRLRTGRTNKNLL